MVNNNTLHTQVMLLVWFSRDYHHLFYTHLTYIHIPILPLSFPTNLPLQDTTSCFETFIGPTMWVISSAMVDYKRRTAPKTMIPTWQSLPAL